MHSSTTQQAFKCRPYSTARRASRYPGCCRRFASKQQYPMHRMLDAGSGHSSGMLTGGFAQRVHERNDGRPVLLRRYLIRIHVMRLHTNPHFSAMAAVGCPIRAPLKHAAELPCLFSTRKLACRPPGIQAPSSAAVRSTLLRDIQSRFSKQRCPSARPSPLGTPPIGTWRTPRRPPPRTAAASAQAAAPRPARAA